VKQNTNTMYTLQKQEVNNYPYGRLKTTKFFEVEFSKTKGFRAIETTINPKNGVLNKPHKDTYSMLKVMEVIEGFVKYKSFEYYSTEGSNRTNKFISENYDMFTEEQKDYLRICLLSYIKNTTRSLVAYCGADTEKAIAYFKDMSEKVVKGIKEKTNIFDIQFNEEEINALKVEGYNPFKVTQIA